MRLRFLAATASLLVARAAGAAPELAFLHVEANAGGSSGGHVALRVGDATWHYQNQAGLLLLVREDSRRFVHDTALIENRPIHVLRVGVSAEAERRVRERFQARLGAQQSQLDALAALRAERELLALLARRAAGSPLRPGEGIAVAGAGYFAAPGWPFEPDPALARLRARVARERGESFLARRADALRRELQALAPSPGAAPALPRLDAGVALPASDGFGARAADLAAGIEALRVLAQARPLQPDAIWSGGDAAPALDADAVRALRAFRERLADTLPALLDATRPDWGTALLVGMARLAALDASLREGRLRVLDAYPERAARLDSARLRREPGLLPALLVDARARVDRELAAFAAREPGARQAAWSDLEDSANRHRELARAAATGSALRVQPERLVPMRAAPFAELAAPPAAAGSLAAALERTAAGEGQLERELGRVHGYELVTHNCVSELFATLSAAFAGDPILEGEALGGLVDGRQGLEFIPFAAAASVSRHWRLVGRETIPSLRQTRVAAMREREGELAVALREASPLTARAGADGARESFFLFYTDDAVWPRPLFGALNLGAAAGETALGLVAAPFDRGRTLLRGLEGALMSLPELAFVNLRKGSYDWVPESARREIGVAP